MTNLDAVMKLAEENNPTSGLLIQGKCESDLSGVTLTDGASLKFSFSDVESKKAELQAEYDAQEYARNRQVEYPTIVELTISLFDAGDKAALVAKRAAVKTKWPKDNSGPVE